MSDGCSTEVGKLVSGKSVKWVIKMKERAAGKGSTQ